MSHPSLLHPFRMLATPLPWAVIGLGLRLVPGDGPRSSLAWVDWPLYAAVIGGLVVRLRGGVGLMLRPAGLAYVLMVLGFGAVYELSLTVDGTGWGGMHPDTRTSFVLAFGDYLMLALACLAAVRWMGLDAMALYALSFGASMTEGLVFTGVVWQLPALWVPLYVAYYGLAYATFLVLPALILNPAPLWSQPAPRRWHPGLLIVLGFAMAFGIRVVWGLLYGPVVTDLFNLLPAVP